MTNKSYWSYALPFFSSYSVFPDVFSFNAIIPYFAIEKYIFTFSAVKTLIIQWDRN